MAATIYVEVERGVFTGPVHRHQGYYAGDFGSRHGQDDDCLPAAPRYW